MSLKIRQVNCKNLNKLEQRCKEEWGKTPPEQCEKLIKFHTENDYFKLLLSKVDLHAIES